MAEESFKAVAKAKCKGCEWEGKVEETVKKYVGIPHTEDVECLDQCPVCGNEDLEYE